MARLCLSFSYLLHCEIFLICLMCRSHSGKYFCCCCSRPKYSIYSCRFNVSMAGSEFRILLRCHLEQELTSFFFLIIHKVCYPVQLRDNHDYRFSLQCQKLVIRCQGIEVCFVQCFTCLANFINQFLDQDVSISLFSHNI